MSYGYTYENYLRNMNKIQSQPLRPFWWCCELIIAIATLIFAPLPSTADEATPSLSCRDVFKSSTGAPLVRRSGAQSTGLFETVDASPQVHRLLRRLERMGMQLRHVDQWPKDYRDAQTRTRHTTFLEVPSQAYESNASLENYLTEFFLAVERDNQKSTGQLAPRAAQLMNRAFEKLGVSTVIDRSMSRRIYACASEREIRFNWRALLVTATTKGLDQVDAAIHELTHSTTSRQLASGKMTIALAGRATKFLVDKRLASSPGYVGNWRADELEARIKEVYFLANSKFSDEEKPSAQVLLKVVLGDVADFIQAERSVLTQVLEQLDHASIKASIREVPVLTVRLQDGLIKEIEVPVPRGGG